MEEEIIENKELVENTDAVVETTDDINNTGNEVDVVNNVDEANAEVVITDPPVESKNENDPVKLREKASKIAEKQKAIREKAYKEGNFAKVVEGEEYQSLVKESKTLSSLISGIEQESFNDRIKNDFENRIGTFQAGTTNVDITPIQNFDIGNPVDVLIGKTIENPDNQYTSVDKQQTSVRTAAIVATTGTHRSRLILSVIRKTARQIAKAVPRWTTNTASSTLASIESPQSKVAKAVRIPNEPACIITNQS